MHTSNRQAICIRMLTFLQQSVCQQWYWRFWSGLQCLVVGWELSEVSRNLNAFIFRVNQSKKTQTLKYYNPSKQQGHIPEAWNFHQHHCKNLKFTMTIVLHNLYDNADILRTTCMIIITFLAYITTLTLSKQISHIPSLPQSNSCFSLFLAVSLGIGILSSKLRKFFMNISLGCCLFSTTAGSNFQT